MPRLMRHRYAAEENNSSTWLAPESTRMHVNSESSCALASPRSITFSSQYAQRSLACLLVLAHGHF